jgi:hypothetical protein
MSIPAAGCKVPIMLSWSVGIALPPADPVSLQGVPHAAMALRQGRLPLPGHDRDERGQWTVVREAGACQ